MAISPEDFDSESEGKRVERVKREEEERIRQLFVEKLETTLNELETESDAFDVYTSAQGISERSELDALENHPDVLLGKTIKSMLERLQKNK